MPIGLRLPYARIVACDFEYRAAPGDRSGDVAGRFTAAADDRMGDPA